MIRLLIALSAIMTISIYSSELPKPSQKNIKSARIIAEIYRDFRKANRKNQSIFKTTNFLKFSKAKRYLRKDPTFKNYLTDIEFIESISKIKNWSQFAGCKTLVDQQNSSAFLEIKLTECRIKFLKILQKRPVLSKGLKDFLKNNMNFYLTKGSDHFISFLKNNQKNQKKVLEITELINTHTMSTGIPLKTSILANLNITPALTKTIQSVGLDNGETRKIFKQELIQQLAEINRTKFNREKLIKESFKFYEKNKNLISTNLLRRRLSILTKRLIRDGDFKSASLVTKKIFEFTSDKSYSDDAFLYLWPDILLDNYKAAAKKITDSGIINNMNKLSPKSLFWVAHTLENQEQLKVSKYFYQEIIKKYPINYYAIMAMKQLKNFNGKNEISDALLNPLYRWETIPFNEISKISQNALFRILAFSRISEMKLMKYEQKKLQKEPISEILKSESLFPKYSEEKIKESLSMLIADALRNDKNYINSFSIIYNQVSKEEIMPSTKLLNMLFPRPYLPTIKGIVSNRIDPLIVLSLIRQESAFNPKAKSHVGARGLMQLMPATAKGLNRRISSRSLNNPQINLRLGIKYLKRLFNKYDGNLVYTLSAYNAGESRVKAWKKTYFKHNKSFMHQVESIPFNETNLYVKLIIRNLFFYKLLEGHKVDSENHNRIFDVALVRN